MGAAWGVPECGTTCRTAATSQTWRVQRELIKTKKSEIQLFSDTGYVSHARRHAPAATLRQCRRCRGPGAALGPGHRGPLGSPALEALGIHSQSCLLLCRLLGRAGGAHGRGGQGGLPGGGGAPSSGLAREG